MNIPSGSSSSDFYITHTRTTNVKYSMPHKHVRPTSAVVICEISFTGFSGVAGMTGSGSGVP